MKANHWSIGLCCCLGWLLPAASGQQPRPNILFIVMDDVGIDQLASFGYGGPEPVSTPVLDRVAAAGLRFRNVWAMPECSPSRAHVLRRPISVPH